MHKKDNQCYICAKKGIDIYHFDLEEHHVFGGPNRKLSEHYGLKVYLCINHHRCGREAVHKNTQIMQDLHEDGQRAFEKANPGLNFREIFGKNYLPGNKGINPEYAHFINRFMRVE